MFCMKSMHHIWKATSRINNTNSRGPISVLLKPLHLTSQIDGLRLQSGDDIVHFLSHYQTRENCRCDMCTLKPSRQRNVNNAVLIAESNNITIKHANIDGMNNCIRLKWSDNHEGYIDVDELLNEDRNLSRNINPNITHDTLWTSWWTSRSVHSYNCADVMHNDKTVLDFINELQTNGLCLIQNSIAEENTAIQIAERLSTNVFPTVFGKSFIVSVNSNAQNAAFTNIELAVHTDVPYLNLVPEYFVLHCIENAENASTGASIFSDGWRAANEMRIHFPEQFEILTKMHILFRDHQHDWWDLMSYKKIIELTEKENEYKIHYNEGVRSSLHWKIDNQVKKDVYYALSIFSSLVQNEEFQFHHQMASGDCFVFSNTRILHGRRAFEGNRKMEGCFFSQDALSVRTKQLQTSYYSIKAD